MRYNSDGSLDSSFGSDGKVILPSTGFFAVDFCNDVFVRPNGKILAAGLSQVAMLDTDFLLVQFNSDGTVDQSFGNNGVVFTGFAGDMDDAISIALGARWSARLQSDDKIVVAGSAQVGSGSDFALLRYESVSTPVALIGRTITLVNSLNLPAGTTKSLNSQLSDALAAVLAGNDAEACVSLKVFINHAQAQTGRRSRTVRHKNYSMPRTRFAQPLAVSNVSYGRLHLTAKSPVHGFKNRSGSPQDHTRILLVGI